MSSDGTFESQVVGFILMILANINQIANNEIMAMIWCIMGVFVLWCGKTMYCEKENDKK